MKERNKARKKETKKEKQRNKERNVEIKVERKKERNKENNSADKNLSNIQLATPSGNIPHISNTRQRSTTSHQHPSYMLATSQHYSATSQQHPSNIIAASQAREIASPIHLHFVETCPDPRSTFTVHHPEPIPKPGQGNT
jgi:hypothetical protein